MLLRYCEGPALLVVTGLVAECGGVRVEEKLHAFGAPTGTVDRVVTVRDLVHSRPAGRSCVRVRRPEADQSETASGTPVMVYGTY